MTLLALLLLATAVSALLFLAYAALVVGLLISRALAVVFRALAIAVYLWRRRRCRLVR
jgi:hypothetical protein